MLETTKDYELAYLLDPRLSDEEISQWQENFKIFLTTEMTGEFKKEINAKKRKLAYPIKKQSLAFFGVIYFMSPPEKIDSLEKRLKVENKLIRYLILQIDQRQKKEMLRKEKEILEKVFKTPFALDTQAEIEKKKVGLEELDKKLEEILEKKDESK